VARVRALIPDLLFGSNVQGALRAAGHDVELSGDVASASAGLEAVDVLVVDLASGTLDGCALVSDLRQQGQLDATRTLGFYSHVDVDTRARAEQAGFDLVVPRSRMAREGAALVERLVAN
jgi:CheY-like chemotaxis protein